jgi:hypothetical protein
MNFAPVECQTRKELRLCSRVMQEPSIPIWWFGRAHAMVSNNTLVPTRKGEAPLLAAQHGRWALG